MTQSPQPAASAPTATPAQPAGQAAPTIARVGGPESNVYTARDVAMLRARGDELSRQLRSADGRRRSLQQSLRGAVGADKTGLEQRLAVLDARIARIERDIEENGRALASPSATLVAAQGSAQWGGPRGEARDYSGPIATAFILCVLAPIAIGYARRLWRRGAEPRAATSPETAHRLERMEQAIDAVAIEVERVSEGQRFVTRLLSEGRLGSAAAAGQQPDGVLVREERPTPR